MRIVVISARYPPATGGVADYTGFWSKAMTELGHDVSVVTSSVALADDQEHILAFSGTWSPRGVKDLAELIRSVRPEVIVVQYVPHAYSPRGGGISFARLVSALNKAVDVPIIINAHEIYGDWSESLRRAPWHFMQRIAAGVLLGSTAAFVVTVSRRERRLRRGFWPWRSRITMIPIGPTVAPVAANPLWRAHHEVTPTTFVLSAFGLGHPTQDVAQLRSTLDVLSAHSIDARLFVAGAMKVDHPLATALGFLDAVNLSQLISASDVFALPFTDGISTRRSSAVSALASGALVVSTQGRDTDMDLFGSSGIVLSPAGDSEAFSRVVLGVAQDVAGRQLKHEQSRAFFDENLSWPIVASQWTGLIKSIVSER